MIFLDSQETKANRQLMFELDKKSFGSELLYRDSATVDAGINHPMSIYSSALTVDGKTMIAYLSMTVFNERYFQKLLRGDVKEEEFEPWDEHDTPLLFLRNLVVKDRGATPYIFRNAFKQLHRLFVDYELYVHRVFTITSHWVTRRALKLYAFEDVGMYQGKYPIMLASRDKSAVVNSFLKRYEAV